MNQSVLIVVNNMKQHSTFKQDKKLKQLERKRNAMINKKLYYCFGMMKTVNQ